MWATWHLWSCPQLSSCPLTPSCLPAPAARSTGCAAPGVSHHPTLLTAQDMWAGWENEGIPLHSANILKLISDNMMMGAGVPCRGPSWRLWDSRNSRSAFMDLGTCIQVTSSHLLPLQQEPEIQGDPRPFAGVTVKRALAQDSCERTQQRERKKKKMVFVLVWTKPLLLLLN